MLHIGLQVKDKKQFEEMEQLLNNIGIKSFENFSKEESGIYFMSADSIKDCSNLSQFTDEEIEEEFYNRDI